MVILLVLRIFMPFSTRPSYRRLHWLKANLTIVLRKIVPSSLLKSGASFKILLKKKIEVYSTFLTSFSLYSSNLFFFLIFWSQIVFIFLELELRTWTKENFETRCADFAWNSQGKNSVAILPVVHGTSITIAWKVCHGGIFQHMLRPYILPILLFLFLFFFIFSWLLPFIY